MKIEQIGRMNYQQNNVTINDSDGKFYSWYEKRSAAKEIECQCDLFIKGLGQLLKGKIWDVEREVRGIKKNRESVFSNQLCKLEEDDQKEIIKHLEKLVAFPWDKIKNINFTEIRNNDLKKINERILD